MQKCAIDPLHLPPPSSPILPGLHGSDNTLDYIWAKYMKCFHNLPATCSLNISAMSGLNRATKPLMVGSFGCVK